MPTPILNRQKPADKPFVIRAKAGDTSAEIVIYDQIGADWFGNGVTLKSFAEELKKLPDTVKNITVRINSPGGDVFDGIGIYNRLKQHKAKKTVYIDGMAASIASIIALAGDEVIMGEGAQFMIHKPWTFTMGNSDDLDATSQRLLDIEDQMLGIYMRRSDLSRDELKAMLKAETWMDADAAMEAGFADKTFEESMPIAASAFDKQWINKAPKKYNSLSDAAKKEAQALIAEIDLVLKKK